ncbi:hypothetical protein B0H16DRAFT_1258431, partial [Mycena metata]
INTPQQLVLHQPNHSPFNSKIVPRCSFEMSTAHLRTRLAEIDASIAAHKLSLEALERDRTTVAAELYSKATFPVLTLPVEITIAIFTSCLPTIEELHENNFRRRDDSATPPTLTAPNVLMECCRAWRDIAVATPSLW